MTTPFPFIVGCGRSGSTLLRSMLDAHPDMVVPNESYFLEQLMLREDGFEIDGAFCLSTFLSELEGDARYQTWGVDTDVVRSALAAEAPQDLAQAIRVVYGAAARSFGGTRSADKTPHYSEVVPELAALLPDAVFVHLIRDPRDVAASYLGTPFGPRSLVSAATMWVERAGAVKAAGEQLGPDRYLEVIYEELVADPEPQLRRLCEFIDLPFDEAMLHPETSSAAKMSAGRDGGAHANLMAGATIRTRDWRTGLTTDEAARVGVVVDELATGFGYDPSPSLRISGRPRFVAERLLGAGESVSRRFRRTRFANRLRGPWRTLRGRATAEQIGIAPA